MNRFYEIIEPDGGHLCFIAVLTRHERFRLESAGYQIIKHTFARVAPAAAKAPSYEPKP